MGEVALDSKLSRRGGIGVGIMFRADPKTGYKGRSENRVFSRVFPHPRVTQMFVSDSNAFFGKQFRWCGKGVLCGNTTLESEALQPENLEP